MWLTQRTGKNIIARSWLLIDASPVRTSGISATDSEKALAMAIIRKVKDYLRDKHGWPNPILADSGNGYHMIYRIDLPADDGGLVQRCREIRQGEALAGAGKGLTDALMTATDAPRDATGVKRSDLPHFFRKWAPGAWVDLLDSLPDEEVADEISDPARDEFRHRVATSLFSLASLQIQRNREGGDTAPVPRRLGADFRQAW